MQDLVDDLLGGEVAAQPQPPGRAERAAHRAADLRRDADGGAPGDQHEDGLDGMTVRRREEGLARRALRRDARLHLGERHGREPLGQRLAQGQRQSRHGREVRDEPPGERLVHLAGAIRRARPSSAMVAAMRSGASTRPFYAGQGMIEANAKTLSRPGTNDPGPQLHDDRPDHRDRCRSCLRYSCSSSPSSSRDAAARRPRTRRALPAAPSSTRLRRTRSPVLGKAEQPVEDITIDPAMERAAAAQRAAERAAAERAAEPVPERAPQPGGLGLDWGPDLSVRTSDLRDEWAEPARRDEDDAEITGELRPDETVALPPERRTPGPRGGERRPGGRHAARAAR